MKKNHKNLLLAISLSTAIASKAQVANYSFSQLSGTYTAITGGTVFGTTTSDDQVFVDPATPAGNAAGSNGPGLPIGFTFTFNNIPMDRFGISNNGWVFFGQSTSTPAVDGDISSNYLAISGTSASSFIQQHRIAGLSRDLQGQTNSNLRVETIGAAPNRTCVIQWSNYRKFNVTGDNFNFQIRLLETANVIDVAYGTFTTSATANSTCEIGLRGGSNADFNNRNVTSTTGWSASLAGTTNTNNCAFNATLTPVSGLIFRWTPPPPCAGAPAANVATSIQTLVCPGGNVNLSLTNTYTNSSILYQWQSSTTSSVGPFSPIGSVSPISAITITNQPVTTWYRADIICSASSNTTSSSPRLVTTQGTIINSVPYAESFEGISASGQLPNCSWARTSTLICQTFNATNLNNRIPRTGSNYASFRFGTNANGDYFYSNGIQLEPGITYSASVWYITDGSSGWSNISLLMGSSQSTTGLTALASSTGIVTGSFYQPLSNTFTVASSGVYYLAVRCIGNTSPNFLTFDDLEVIIPCSLNPTSLNVSASSPTICSGSSTQLIASGANNYVWSTGVTTSTINVSPLFNNTYSVSGTNTLTGCSVSSNVTVYVNQKPVAYILRSNPAVCVGQSATLTAIGSNNFSYSWNTGISGSSVIVTPAANTGYSVVVNDPNGCSVTLTTNVGVNPLPQVFAQSSNSGTFCAGEDVMLVASGVGLVSFQWSSNNTNILSQTAIVSPKGTTIYTLTAANALGCANTATLLQFSAPCTSINEAENIITANNLYPNPTSGKFVIKTTTNTLKEITICDVSGRVVSKTITSEANVELNVENVANGIYYVKIVSDKTRSTIKLIKQ